jgi:hypothetical protein
VTDEPRRARAAWALLDTAGRLVLTELGRRFDTFTRALRLARNQARVAGLLAHGPAMPEVFDGAMLSSGSAQPVELQVYPTHITIVPGDSDPWQLPFGAQCAGASAGEIHKPRRFRRRRRSAARQIVWIRHAARTLQQR